MAARAEGFDRCSTETRWADGNLNVFCSILSVLLRCPSVLKVEPIVL